MVRRRGVVHSSFVTEVGMSLGGQNFDSLINALMGDVGTIHLRSGRSVRVQRVCHVNETRSIVCLVLQDGRRRFIPLRKITTICAY